MSCIKGKLMIENLARRSVGIKHGVSFPRGLLLTFCCIYVCLVGYQEFSYNGSNLNNSPGRSEREEIKAVIPLDA